MDDAVIHGQRKYQQDIKVKKHIFERKHTIVVKNTGLGSLKLCVFVGVTLTVVQFFSPMGSDFHPYSGWNLLWSNIFFKYLHVATPSGCFFSPYLV